MELQAYSNAQILQMLGLRFKQYRLMADFSQEELAKVSGVSVSTIHKFETGTLANMTVSNLMALLRRVGLLEQFDELVPEQPENPYATRPRKRARKHGNG